MVKKSSLQGERLPFMLCRARVCMSSLPNQRIPALCMHYLCRCGDQFFFVHGAVLLGDSPIGTLCLNFWFRKVSIEHIPLWHAGSVLSVVV